MEPEENTQVIIDDPDLKKDTSLNKFLLPIFILLLLITGAVSYYMGKQKLAQSSPSPTSITSPTITESASPEGTSKPEVTETATPTAKATQTATPSASE